MSDTTKLPTIAEEFRAFNPGVVIIATYYALEFGSLQGLYPLINLLKIPTISSIVALAYALLLLIKGRVRFNVVMVWYTVFLLYLIANAYWLTGSLDSREAVIKLSFLYLAYFIIGSTVICRLDSVILLLDILLAFMAFSVLHGILQGGLLWGSQWLSDENIYAVFCCTGIPFAYVLLLQYPSKIKKLCYATCLCLFVIGVVLAASRGGFLALAIIVGFVWLQSEKKIRGFLLLVVLGGGIFLALPPGIVNEFKQITVDAQKGGAGEREYLWRLAGDMFKDHKVFGVGVGNYGEFFPAYDQMSEARDTFGGVNWRGMKMVAHSTPVTFLSETGLVGVTLLSFVLFYFFRQLVFVLRMAQKQLHRLFALATITAMLSFWAGALFLSLLIYPFFYNLILLGALVSQVKIDINDL